MQVHLLSNQNKKKTPLLHDVKNGVAGATACPPEVEICCSKYFGSSLIDSKEIIGFGTDRDKL